MSNDGTVAVWTGTLDNGDPLRVEIMPDAWAFMGDLAEQYPKGEVGGFLLGLKAGLHTVRVCMATEPPPGSEIGGLVVRLNMEGDTIPNLQKLCDDNQYYWLGTWHSHPQGSKNEPSMGDLRHLIACSDPGNGFEPLMVVIAKQGDIYAPYVLMADAGMPYDLEFQGIEQEQDFAVFALDTPKPETDNPNRAECVATKPHQGDRP